MMQKRDMKDLWTYDRFSRELRQHYGLSDKTHVRYCEDRDGRCVIYVVRRASPRRGFEYGNFAVSEPAVKWMISQQDRDKINSAYVCLVEDFGGDIVAWDTAKNIWQKVRCHEPNVGEGGVTYYWMSGDLEPVGVDRGGGKSISEPPF